MSCIAVGAFMGAISSGAKVGLMCVGCVVGFFVLLVVVIIITDAAEERQKKAERDAEWDARPPARWGLRQHILDERGVDIIYFDAWREFSGHHPSHIHGIQYEMDVAYHDYQKALYKLENNDNEQHRIAALEKGRTLCATYRWTRGEAEVFIDGEPVSIPAVDTLTKDDLQSINNDISEYNCRMHTCGIG